MGYRLLNMNCIYSKVKELTVVFLTILLPLISYVLGLVPEGWRLTIGIGSPVVCFLFLGIIVLYDKYRYIKTGSELVMERYKTTTHILNIEGDCKEEIEAVVKNYSNKGIRKRMFTVGYDTPPQDMNMRVSVSTAKRIKSYKESELDIRDETTKSEIDNKKILFYDKKIFIPFDPSIKPNEEANYTISYSWIKAYNNIASKEGDILMQTIQYPTKTLSINVIAPPSHRLYIEDSFVQDKNEERDFDLTNNLQKPKRNFGDRTITWKIQNPMLSFSYVLKLRME